MERPGVYAVCISCKHFFGEHYLSFNEKLSGCADITGPVDDSHQCKCRGFAVIYKPSTSPVDSDEYEKEIVDALDNDPERFGSWNR